MTDGEIAVWCSTLSPVSLEAGRSALAALRSEVDWLPTHHQFLDAAQFASRRLARQAAERELAPPDECALCDGTGFVEVDDPRGFYVKRCRCQPAPKGNEGHAKGCTCGPCAYGTKRWANILAGKDGAQKGSTAGELSADENRVWLDKLREAIKRP